MAYIELTMTSSIPSASGLVQTSPRAVGQGPVRIWLYVVAAMILVMIVVGGATRLTDSGLSITEWQPIHGAIPPLNAAEWEEEFAKYRQIPQYELINKGMTLAEFKTIFWWEWAHRLLGRLIGLVFFVPLVFFWATGRIERRMKAPLVFLLFLGGLQGAIGWWMVTSGLSERTDVSQYRLAVHLTLACLILGYLVWLACGLSPFRRVSEPAGNGLRAVASILVALVFVQIFLGGLVAGLNAGMSYTTWPLMDGAFVPTGLLVQEPVWRNVFENVATVQFDHRMGAYALLVAALLHAIQAQKTAYRRSAFWIVALVAIQAVIGIATLVMVVPLHLALTHQVGAAVVLWASVVHLRAMTADETSPVRGTVAAA